MEYFIFYASPIPLSKMQKLAMENFLGLKSFSQKFYFGKLNMISMIVLHYRDTLKSGSHILLWKIRRAL